MVSLSIAIGAEMYKCVTFGGEMQY